MPIRRIGIGRLGDQSITDIITQAAQAQGVPISLALAQAQQESSLVPSKIGAKGEIGLFQLRPEYFSGQGDLTDPTINANVGLAYLFQQFQLTSNWRDALIAYNEGPTAWSQGQRYASSQAYADAVLAAAGMTGGTTTPPVTSQPAPTSPPRPLTPPVAPGPDLATVALIAVGGIALLEVLS